VILCPTLGTRGLKTERLVSLLLARLSYGINGGTGTLLLNVEVKRQLINILNVIYF
jgi:hypothetical protein